MLRGFVLGEVRMVARSSRNLGGLFYTMRWPVRWYPELVIWESYENISQAWSGVPRHSPEGPLPFQGSRYGENQTKATANKNRPYPASPQTPARLGQKWECLCSSSLPSDRYSSGCFDVPMVCLDENTQRSVPFSLVCVLVTQLCLTLCDPLDRSPPWDFPGKNARAGTHSFLLCVHSRSVVSNSLPLHVM